MIIEEGPDALQSAVDVLNSAPELIEKEGSFTNAVKNVIAIEKKGGRGSQFANQTKEQLLKSKATYEELIKEHETKLAEYICDPIKNDNKGLLQQAISEEIKQKRIQGRIIQLKQQIRRQKLDLNDINDLLLRG